MSLPSDVTQEIYIHKHSLGANFQFFVTCNYQLFRILLKLFLKIPMLIGG